MSVHDPGLCDWRGLEAQLSLCSLHCCSWILLLKKKQPIVERVVVGLKGQLERCTSSENLSSFSNVRFLVSMSLVAF